MKRSSLAVSISPGRVLNRPNPRKCLWTQWRTLLLLATAAASTDVGRSQSGIDAFSPEVNGTINAIVAQADEKIVIGGWFNRVNGQSRLNLARLHPDGRVDDSFNPGALNGVFSLALQPDGGILVGTVWSPAPGSPILRLHPDGTVDERFQATAGGHVHCVALQADGKIVVAGSFLSLDAEHCIAIGRLHADGRRDPSFAVANITSFHSLAVLSGDKILLAGAFPAGSGVATKLLRLQSNGSVDETFAEVSLDLPVYSILTQADGRILLGGAFGWLGVHARNRVGRLYPDGSVDVSFDTGPGDDDRDADDTVMTMALQADGKVIVGGELTNLGDRPRRGIGRLNADGSLDTDFATDADQFVAALAIQRDGKTLVGGGFHSLHGQSRTSLGRILPTVRPPKLTAVRLEDGVFWFSFSNPDEAVFSVLAATNIQAPVLQWELLGTPMPAGGGIHQFTDATASNHPRRFYQLRSP